MDLRLAPSARHARGRSSKIWVGSFAHEYRPLGQDELYFVLERRWRKLGQTLDLENFTDAQAIAAGARITRGNFRFIDCSSPKWKRVMKIKELNTITDDIIEAARSILVIGIS